MALSKRAKNLKTEIDRFTKIGRADVVAELKRTNAAAWKEIQNDGVTKPSTPKPTTQRSTPASSSARTSSRTLSPSRQRAARARNIEQQSDGTWAIVGDAGVFERGFATRREALARQDSFVTHGLETGITEERAQDLQRIEAAEAAELVEAPTTASTTAPITEAPITTEPEIDMTGLTPEEQEAAQTLADQAINSDLVYQPQLTPENIRTFIAEGVAAATEETDPFFNELISRATEAYVQGVTFESNARALQLQQQKLNEARELKTAQEDLELRGATSSGEAVELLGELSALPPDLRENVEGLLQQQQGITASTTQQRFAENVAHLTQAAEEQLGTDVITGATGELPTLAQGLARGLPTSTRGSIAAERETTRQTRGRELARGRVAQELLTSPDFPVNSDALNLLI